MGPSSLTATPGGTGRRDGGASEPEAVGCLVGCGPPNAASVVQQRSPLPRRADSAGSATRSVRPQACGTPGALSSGGWPTGRAGPRPSADPSLLVVPARFVVEPGRGEGAPASSTRREASPRPRVAAGRAGAPPRSTSRCRSLDASAVTGGSSLVARDLAGRLRGRGRGPATFSPAASLRRMTGPSSFLGSSATVTYHDEDGSETTQKGGSTRRSRRSSRRRGVLSRPFRPRRASGMLCQSCAGTTSGRSS